MDDLYQRRIYVASPLGAPTSAAIQTNIARAQRLCMLAMQHEGVAAFAPHGFYTAFLDDTDPEERELGRQAGLTWLESADQLWCFTKAGITGGMREEIEIAEGLGIEVVRDPSCFDGVDS